MPDSRLEKLRLMDPTIGTFTASQLIADPKNVDETYLEHAETHMSLGDMSDCVSKLIHAVIVNKHVAIGAVTGEYGYGKTSSEIHLWQQCEKRNIIAIPPFEWHKLQDIVDVTRAWICYKIISIQPGLVKGIEAIYNKYRAQSIEEFAEREDVPVSRVKEWVEQGTIRLDCNSEKVVEFLSEVNLFIEGIKGWYGPVVFTDELQVTMSEYNKRHLSRDAFMEDLFGLLNPLLNRKGSYGIIIGLPLNTETLITSARPDIIQRLQNSGLFIRPNNMFTRDFPINLWHKFADTFNFKEIASKIMPDDTLDSLGQIAFRNDLGAGPRTVIQAMKRAIEHYDKESTELTPIDLINLYLENKIAFDASGKLITVVNEVLQSNAVKTREKADQAIKLMAAFPLGCPESYFTNYQLSTTKEEITKEIFFEYLYKFPEGISLRKLAQTPRPAEPRFIELTKEFIQTYSESERDIDAAIKAFTEIIILEQLLSGANRRGDQIDGWTQDPQNKSVFIGTFDKAYPERRVSFIAAKEKDDLLSQNEEFGIGFLLMPNCDYSLPGKVEIFADKTTSAIIGLNLLCRAATPLRLPYFEDLGYPIDKITPAFMLSLLDYLQVKGELIPEDEKTIQVPTFKRTLTTSIIEMLFTSDLLTNSEIEGLNKVGIHLPREVAIRLFKSRYPDYVTLITTGRWEGGYAQLKSVLENNKISSSIGVLRGNKHISMTQNESLALFGETKIQAIKGLMENLADCLEIDLGSRENASTTIRFKLHPAETAFMEFIRASQEKVKHGINELRAVDTLMGITFLRNLGYRDIEIAIIIGLLKTRRLVDLDEKHDCFFEVLESPDERRDYILSIIHDIQSKVDILAEIPDFEIEEINARISHLQDEVTNCSDIEALEDYQNKLVDLTNEINSFTKNWADKLISNFETIKNETDQILHATLPDGLSNSIKSDVNWVGELTACQSLLKEKYQKCLTAFKTINRQATEDQKKWGNTASNQPKSLISLYSAVKTSKSELENAKLNLSAARNYLQGFVSWDHVLNSASRVYKDALNCQSTYKNDTYKIEAEKIFERIVDNLSKKKLEALANHEVFDSQLQKLQAKVDEWLRDRREQFMNMKIEYENSLKAIGIGQFNIRAVFDPFDPETSRGNLYEEVIDKVKGRIQELEHEFNRYTRDIIFAEKVFGSDVSNPKERLTAAKESKEKISVTESNIQDQSTYAILCADIKSLSELIDQISISIKGILEKRVASAKEEVILELLREPTGTDLSTLIVERLNTDGERFSLDEFLKDVIELFKKNQIIIRIEKRR
jgi:hypothetical protein